MPLTGTDHCYSRFLKMIFTFRETTTHFRAIIFSQSSRFQFSSPILDGLCVSFNVHHFFMRKQFICIDCYTGRLTFSNIILHKKAIRWILVASQAEMRKDECARSCSIWMETVYELLWRVDPQIALTVTPSSPILGPKITKAFRVFTPGLHLGDLE